LSHDLVRVEKRGQVIRDDEIVKIKTNIAFIFMSGSAWQLRNKKKVH